MSTPITMMLMTPVRTLSLLLVLGGTAVAGALDAERERVLVVRDDGVSVWFEVEVARTTGARSDGLMHRRNLPPRHGMWFDFGRDQPIVMWMKDTPIPLDMVFVGDDGRISAVHAHAVPFSHARIAAPEPARYVLEINAGEAAAYGLREGAQVTPVAGAGSAWSRTGQGAGGVPVSRKASKARPNPSRDNGIRSGCRSPS